MEDHQSQHSISWLVQGILEHLEVKVKAAAPVTRTGHVEAGKEAVNVVCWCSGSKHTKAAK